MNREQQKVLELLKEIDTICRKNKITYYLSPYLTLCAVTERPFPMNPASNDIYMKTGDMARFKNIFDEEPELRRTLESMENNSRFPGFFCVIQIKIHCFISWTSMENTNIRDWESISFRCSVNMAQRENISGTVCAKRDGKGSTEKKASGETGVSWNVSGWCESFPFADEAGWQRAYSGICSGSRRMAQNLCTPIF